MQLQAEIKQAVTILKQGGLVAFPTETVYGLGADARNEDALKKVFQAKGRPIDHPLIVHIADISQLSEWAIDISASALLLAKTFWPGPLTLILKKSPGVLDLITGNQDTIGLRVPNHPLAHALLQAYGGGLAAPSANRFGRISPTTAEAVREELGDAVDMILDGGSCEVGVESSIVDMTRDAPVILRPGMISAEQIESVLQTSIITSKNNIPRVSGSMELHYAPHTLTKLIDSKNLSQFFTNLSPRDLPLAVLSLKQITVTNKQIHNVVMPDNPRDYAHDLYRILRSLDKKNLQQIVIESVPNGVKWDAIRDRLNKACGKRG